MSSARGARLPIRPPLISLGIAIAILLTWEFLSDAGLIHPLLAPAPTVIVRTLVRQIATGEIGQHLIATLRRVISGLVIGGVSGVTMGILMGTMPRLRSIVDPFVAAIHPLPKIAILPVVMAIMGLGDASRIAVVALAVFFPMMINTLVGVRQINTTHLDVARNYGASGWKLFTRVIWPASLPMILAGVRIALNMALLLTISIEIASASVGLGSLIWMSWEVLRIDVLYSTLLVIMALGIISNLIFRAVAYRLVPWAGEQTR